MLTAFKTKIRIRMKQLVGKDRPCCTKSNTIVTSENNFSTGVDYSTKMKNVFK